MKKLFAILLLALLLFNLAGYRLFFQLIQKQHKVSLEASLDKNQFKDNDLLEIRIPLSMPYLQVETTFERVDGEVSFDGQFYKYVKRKVENGQLILLCIRDYRKTNIEHAKTVMGGSVNESPVAAKKNSEAPQKILPGSEYEDASRQLTQFSLLTSQLQHIDYYAALLTPGFTRFAERPPQIFLS